MSGSVDDAEDGVRVGGRVRAGDGKRLAVVQVMEERSTGTGRVHAGFDVLDRTLEPVI